MPSRSSDRPRSAEDDGEPVRLFLRAIDEALPGDELGELFARLWPSYRRWYLRDGERARPSYLECRTALERELPALLPLWERFCELAGGGDLEARFLSQYRTPGYQLGCSQAVVPGPEPMLIRNYDYTPRLFEGILLRSRWRGRTVVAMTDCLIGALDGINEDGLCVALSFGGRREQGDGFSAPLIVRALLELCGTVREARELLAGLHTSMAYSFLVLDAAGEHLTAFLRPDRPATFHRQRVLTNHQGEVAWPRHAAATRTVERLQALEERMAREGSPVDPAHPGGPGDPPARWIHLFLEEPLRSVAFRRGIGTLYTAAYHPAGGRADYHWPGEIWRQRVADFRAGTREVSLHPRP